MINLINKSLNTTIAPMVYIMMFMSLIIGLNFAYGSVEDSILYHTVFVGVAKSTWGIILTVAATLCLSGFVSSNKSLISVGSAAGFATWIYATVLLVMAGHYYIAITVGAFHALFMGYVFLATSMGYLWRQPLDEDPST